MGLPPIARFVGIALNERSQLNLGCNILHLEDDDNDSLFFQRALEHLNFTGVYRRVSTPQKAIDYLSGTSDFADRRLFPLPHALVADSALGNLTGAKTTDLMGWLNEREEFRPIVRMMLTGDISAMDREEWHKRGVACVLLKGATYEDLAESVAEILRRCAH
jgi:hypothetical protein